MNVGSLIDGFCQHSTKVTKQRLLRLHISGDQCEVAYIQEDSHSLHRYSEAQSGKSLCGSNE